MKLNNINLKHLSIGITIFAVVFTIAVIGQAMMIVNQYNYQEEAFLEGMTINQINVSGLGKEEALRAVRTSLKQKVDEMNLTITYDDKSWTFTGADFKLEESVQQVIEEAHAYQQKLIKKEETDFSASTITAKGLNVNVAFNFLFKDINEKVDAIISQVEKAPINSQAYFSADNAKKFTYSKEQFGLRVDKIKLLKDIQKEFAVNHTNMQVKLSTVSVDPEVTEANLKEQTKLVSIFSTDLHNSKQRRLNNVSLALSKFNGLEVKPGEEVSFNALTSPQTLEGGYEKSIIIFNGRFVEGVGGGLCQASTTLYNALILANLEILEVNKHTLPVGYIELALDSMVSENWSDLRFKNNSPYSIYLAAYIKEERAYVEVYGKTLENGVKLKRRSEFIRTIGHKGDKIMYDETGEYADQVLYKGERYRLSYPREGYEAKGYLQYYSGGNLIKEVQIRHEIYEPQQGIVIEGFHEPPADYTIKESDVQLIEPQEETSDTTGSNVSSVLLKNNPA